MHRFYNIATSEITEKQPKGLFYKVNRPPDYGAGTGLFDLVCDKRDASTAGQIICILPATDLVVLWIGGDRKVDSGRFMPMTISDLNNFKVLKTRDEILKSFE